MPVAKYVEHITLNNVQKFDEPFGPGYQVVFDTTIPVKGYSEIRVWVHVMIRDYQTQAAGPDTQLKVRFLHPFHGNKDEFDYESGTVQTWDGASFVDGYIVKPVIGNELRLICAPVNMPPGPYDVYMTYYLV